MSDRVLDAKADLEKQMGIMEDEVGNLGNYAHVYAKMIGAYIEGTALSNRGITDTDAFSILALGEIAQSALSHKQNRASGLNAAIYMMSKASYSPYPGGEEKTGTGPQAGAAPPYGGQDGEPMEAEAVEVERFKDFQNAAYPREARMAAIGPVDNLRQQPPDRPAPPQAPIPSILRGRQASGLRETS